MHKRSWTGCNLRCLLSDLVCPFERLCWPAQIQVKRLHFWAKSTRQWELENIGLASAKFLLKILCTGKFEIEAIQWSAHRLTNTTKIPIKEAEVGRCARFCSDDTFNNRCLLVSSSSASSLICLYYFMILSLVRYLCFYLSISCALRIVRYLSFTQTTQ